MELTDTEWAVCRTLIQDEICLDPKEPKYRFIREERSWAENMVKKGMLKRVDKIGHYKLTSKGRKMYNKAKEETNG